VLLDLSLDLEGRGLKGMTECAPASTTIRLRSAARVGMVALLCREAQSLESDARDESIRSDDA